MAPVVNEFEIVKEDLGYIRDHWFKKIDDGELRRGSAILRRLLVENVLDRHYRQVKGKQVQFAIVSPNLEQILDGVDLSTVVIASAGGATYGGIMVAGLMVRSGAHPPSSRDDGGTGLKHPFQPRDYLESWALVIQGKPVRRRELIKYFANTLGGVHLGQKTRSRERELVERLKKVHGQTEIVGKDGMFFEILSIGQHLVSSPDIIDAFSL